MELYSIPTKSWWGISGGTPGDLLLTFDRLCEEKHSDHVQQGEMLGIIREPTLVRAARRYWEALPATSDVVKRFRNGKEALCRPRIFDGDLKLFIGGGRIEVRHWDCPVDVFPWLEEWLAMRSVERLSWAVHACSREAREIRVARQERRRFHQDRLEAWKQARKNSGISLALAVIRGQADPRQADTYQPVHPAERRALEIREAAHDKWSERFDDKFSRIDFLETLGEQRVLRKYRKDLKYHDRIRAQLGLVRAWHRGLPVGQKISRTSEDLRGAAALVQDVRDRLRWSLLDLSDSEEVTEEESLEPMPRFQRLLILDDCPGSRKLWTMHDHLMLV